MNFNLAVKDSIGGWKENAFLYNSSKACTTLKMLMGNMWSPYFRSFGVNDTSCPIPQVNFFFSNYIPANYTRLLTRHFFFREITPQRDLIYRTWCPSLIFPKRFSTECTKFVSISWTQKPMSLVVSYLWWTLTDRGNPFKLANFSTRNKINKNTF